MSVEYIFSSSRIYPRSPWDGPPPKGMKWHKHGGCLVPEGTLVCYDVVQTSGNNLVGGNTWEFKVRGYEGVTFHTNYDWALVEKTPENIKALHEWTAARALVKEIEDFAKRLHSRIVNIATVKREEVG